MKITATPSTAITLPWETRNISSGFWQAQENLETAAVKSVDANRPPLTPGTFRAGFLFRLDTPYFSGRDRAGLEHTDSRQDLAHNRLCRDWVSGLPLVKGSGWKRFFRACWPGNQEEKELFFGSRETTAETGNHPEGDDQRRRGLFKFHHAVFPNAATETAMINPRNHRTGKGTVPVTYETVPSGQCLEVTIDFLPARANPATLGAAAVKLLQAAVIGSRETIGGKAAADFGCFRLRRAVFHGGGDFTAGAEKLRREAEIADPEITVEVCTSQPGEKEGNDHAN